MSEKENEYIRGWNEAIGYASVEAMQHKTPQEIYDALKDNCLLEYPAPPAQPEPMGTCDRDNEPHCKNAHWAGYGLTFIACANWKPEAQPERPAAEPLGTCDTYDGERPHPKHATCDYWKPLAAQPECPSEPSEAMKHGIWSLPNKWRKEADDNYDQHKDEIAEAYRAGKEQCAMELERQLGAILSWNVAALALRAAVSGDAK